MAKKFYKENIQLLPAVVYASECPQGFTEIIDAEEILHLTKENYVLKEIDGRDFYNTFRSRLLISIQNEEILASDAFAVESYLSMIKDNLISGNWLTAQYVCNSLPYQGIFNEALKTEILTGINNYINENY